MEQHSKTAIELKFELKIKEVGSVNVSFQDQEPLK